MTPWLTVSTIDPVTHVTNRSPLWQALEGLTVSDPAEGVALNAVRLSYRQRESSLHMAERWNSMLATDQMYGPEVCGFKVAAAEKKVNGHFPLVWVKAQ